MAGATTSPMPTPSVPGRVLALIALLICASLLYLGSKEFIAALVAQTPRAEIRQWQTDGVAPTEAWELNKSRLELALTLTPFSATLHEQMAALLLTRVNDPDLSIEATLDLAQSAARHYEEALRLQPSSPWTWTNLALLKYRIPEATDRELADLLTNAYRLGPTRRQVLAVVVGLGFSAWPLMTEGQRAYIAKAFGNGYALNNSQFELLIRNTPDAALFCPEIPLACDFSTTTP